MSRMGRKRKVTVTLPKIGGEGRLEPVPVQVADPYSPSQQTVAVKNIRVNPLDWMYHRGRIDDAQFAAGNRFRSYYEQGEIGASGAIDYSRTKVDGGKLQEPLTEAVYAARRSLAMARQATGSVGYALLVAVVGEGINVGQIGRLRPSLCHGLRGERAEGYVSGRLREALDALVAQWGLVAVGQARCRVRSARDLAVSGPTAEWEVGYDPHKGATLVEMSRRPVRVSPPPRKKKVGKTPSDA